VRVSPPARIAAPLKGCRRSLCFWLSIIRRMAKLDGTIDLRSRDGSEIHRHFLSVLGRMRKTLSATGNREALDSLSSLTRTVARQRRFRLRRSERFVLRCRQGASAPSRPLPGLLLAPSPSGAGLRRHLSAMGVFRQVLPIEVSVGLIRARGVQPRTVPADVRSVA